jgi:hypothetical protein
MFAALEEDDDLDLDRGRPILQLHELCLQSSRARTAASCIHSDALLKIGLNDNFKPGAHYIFLKSRPDTADFAVNSSAFRSFAEKRKAPAAIQYDGNTIAA